MECKCGACITTHTLLQELIDTLWNVNAKLAKALSHLRIGINRYIMECK